MSFQWITPPEIIIKAVADYETKVLMAIAAVAAQWGQGVQDSARRNASWQDRTGNARSGIFYAVDGFGLGTFQGDVPSSAAIMKTDIGIESGDDKTLIITVGHTVFYGKWLEISNGGRYAVIMSEIESHLPALQQQLMALFAN